MIRSIPRKLLIHSAVYQYGPITSDDWGNETHENSKALYRVRIEPSSALKRSKDNIEVQLSAMLFYDARNSSPAGVAFDVGDGILFDDRSYTIVSIDRLYDDSRKLHHLEIGLV